MSGSGTADDVAFKRDEAVRCQRGGRGGGSEGSGVAGQMGREDDGRMGEGEGCEFGVA